MGGCRWMDGGCGGMDDGAEGWAEERPEEKTRRWVGQISWACNFAIRRSRGSVTAIHSRSDTRAVVSCTQATTCTVPRNPTDYERRTHEVVRTIRPYRVQRRTTHTTLTTT